MADVDLTHIVAGLGGSGATGLTMYFLRDFFSSTRKDLRTTIPRALENIRLSIVKLEAKVEASTKDLARVEGVMKSQQDQLTAAVKEWSGLSANIKALWAALQRIHPNAIPKRHSDGG